ncbi:type IV pilus twitching motility protein PilT [Candidatus Beckwithbacteria bacterium]|nr:type IV pilus twitching motility protein PilT [Candidatus Beckwithbacteria bacterium]
MDIQYLLAETIKNHSSDLHLQNNTYPVIRVDGRLKAIVNTPILTPQVLKQLIFSLMTEDQQKFFIENKELDFSFALKDQARFRVNAYIERSCPSAVLRLIPQKIKTIDELNLPDICHKLTSLKAGLVLVTGPTGHGKSSTLAAIIEEINTSRSEKIITIEDPIEYVYQNKKSIISQRELGQDTLSWKMALRSALREDPDVVLVGEMRDLETISATLTIAETGHLVFSTLHTNSASQTIDRIVDVFPAHQQNQIRIQLAATLEAVVSQRLLPMVDGGRVPALEVLLGTPAVKTNIREGKTHLIDNIIQTSQDVGMIPLESYMKQLITEGKITLQTAQMWSSHPQELSNKNH